MLARSPLSWLLWRDSLLSFLSYIWCPLKTVGWHRSLYRSLIIPPSLEELRQSSQFKVIGPHSPSLSYKTGPSSPRKTMIHPYSSVKQWYRVIFFSNIRQFHSAVSAYHCDSGYSLSSATSLSRLHSSIQYIIHCSRSSIIIRIVHLILISLYFIHNRYLAQLHARIATYRLKHRTAYTLRASPWNVIQTCQREKAV